MKLILTLFNRNLLLRKNLKEIITNKNLIKKTFLIIDNEKSALIIVLNNKYNHKNIKILKNPLLVISSINDFSLCR